MAVISVEETDDDEGTVDQEKTDAVRTYIVLCDRREDGWATVLAHPDLPKILDGYYRDAFENWTSSLCRTIKAKRDPGLGRDVAAGGRGWAWRVTANYSSKGDGDEGEENPLLQPPKIKVRTNRFQRPMDVDLDAFITMNSAGMPFDPPCERDDSRPAVTISRNVPFFNLDILETYKDSTNEDAFLGRPELFWKISDFTADHEWWDDHGVRRFYWAVEVEMEANEDLWHPVKILDRGRYELGNESPDPTAPKKLVPIRAGEDNRPVQDPVPLNGSGGRLPEDGDPVYIEFKFYRAANFGALGIL